MGRTPDRRPGEQIEDDYIGFEDRGTDPGVIGALYRKGTRLYAEDEIGSYDLRHPPGAAFPFEVPFAGVTSFVVTHNRGVRPLVQVLTPQATGWNVGGWNNNGWSSYNSKYLRYPDDQYVLEHLTPNQFIVTFSSALTGRVIYF